MNLGGLSEDLYQFYIWSPKSKGMASFVHTKCLQKEHKEYNCKRANIIQYYILKSL